MAMVGDAGRLGGWETGGTDWKTKVYAMHTFDSHKYGLQARSNCEWYCVCSAQATIREPTGSLMTVPCAKTWIHISLGKMDVGSHQ